MNTALSGPVRVIVPSSSGSSIPVWGAGGTNTVTVTLSSNGNIDLSYDNVSVGSYIVGVSKGGAGNSGTQVDLVNATAPVPYTGYGALYQSLGSGAGFSDGAKLTFTK